MKDKILSGSFLLVMVALISIGIMPSVTRPANAGKTRVEPPITVLNPAISTRMAERVPLGPRLNSLEGKTIYLVDMQWGGPEAAYSVFEEMQGWFARNMPSVKIVIKRMSSGPFGDDEGLRKEIVDRKIDGVITGIAGWHGCVSAVSRFSRNLELAKIPTVGASGINVVKFKDYELQYSNGMPIRYVAFPFPVAGQPKSVHKSYVEGKDLLSGKPMMQAIIDALTKPLTDEEKKSGLPPGAALEPRLLKPDTEANLQRLFKDKEFTDFNPIILPTEERVAAMLKGSSRKPDVVVCKYGSREMTVEKAAVIAVMAGAKVEYFPTILAVVSQASSFGNSTSSAANMILVSGPIRKQIGMNSGTDAMGPFSEANSVIGRCFTLAGKIIGDLRIGAGAYSSLGSTLQYNNLCFAENEEDLPQGWEPLSVEMGFKRTDNVVSIGGGWTYISSVGEAQIKHPPHMLFRDYMRSLTGMAATIVMDPTVAALLKDAHGFKTKAELGQWLAKNVEVTASTYWGNGVNTTAMMPMALQGLEPYATWSKAPAETLIKPFTNPKTIQVVVAGGKIQTTWFVTDFRFGRGILIDDWK